MALAALDSRLRGNDGLRQWRQTRNPGTETGRRVPALAGMTVVPSVTSSLWCVHTHAQSLLEVLGLALASVFHSIYSVLWAESEYRSRVVSLHAMRWG